MKRRRSRSRIDSEYLGACCQQKFYHQWLAKARCNHQWRKAFTREAVYVRARADEIGRSGKIAGADGRFQVR